MTVVILVCAACWLVLAGTAVAIGRSPAGSTVIYGGNLLLAVVSLVVGRYTLLAQLRHGGDLAARLPRSARISAWTRSPRSSS